MSHNIKYIRIISQRDFQISEKDFDEVMAGEVPECMYGLEHADIQTSLQRGHLGWTGDGSGHLYERLVNDVLPRFTGEADLLCVWINGAFFTGVRVRNGEVTLHNVEISLGEMTG